MNLHKAILAIHNSVVSINGSTKETITAWDNNGNIVDINWTQVDNWENPNQYKIDRANQYPDFKDYLDGIVKGDQAQIDKYIADCLAVKAKYPKE